jgi:hypothetical protein
MRCVIEKTNGTALFLFIVAGLMMMSVKILVLSDPSWQASRRVSAGCYPRDATRYAHRSRGKSLVNEKKARR